MWTQFANYQRRYSQRVLPPLSINLWLICCKQNGFRLHQEQSAIRCFLLAFHLLSYYRVLDIIWECQPAFYLSFQFLQEERYGLSMQVPTGGCHWSVDVSVSIHPNDTKFRVHPGMARDAPNRQTSEEKEAYNVITYIISSM